jgi:regulator of protease activity HflC (stomatin/prohibitin superfamily)
LFFIIAPDDVITCDNVTVRVTAVTYFNMLNPNRSLVAIENHITGASEIARTTLRSVLGR